MSLGPDKAKAALPLTGPTDRRTVRSASCEPLAIPGDATAALLPVECGGSGGEGCSYYAASGLTGSAATTTPPAAARASALP